MLQEVLEHLGINKTWTIPVHLHVYDVERYVKTVEEHLRKVISMYQIDLDEMLPNFC
jgi:pentose-5-phosphate-3-epimerase